MEIIHGCPHCFLLVVPLGVVATHEIVFHSLASRTCRFLLNRVVCHALPHWQLCGLYYLTNRLQIAIYELQDVLDDFRRYTIRIINSSETLNVRFL